MAIRHGKCHSNISLESKQISFLGWYYYDRLQTIMTDIPKHNEERKQFFLQLFEQYSLENNDSKETIVDDSKEWFIGNSDIIEVDFDELLKEVSKTKAHMTHKKK